MTNKAEIIVDTTNKKTGSQKLIPFLFVNI